LYSLLFIVCVCVND